MPGPHSQPTAGGPRCQEGGRAKVRRAHQNVVTGGALPARTRRDRPDPPPAASRHRWRIGRGPPGRPAGAHLLTGPTCQKKSRPKTLLRARVGVAVSKICPQGGAAGSRRVGQPALSPVPAEKPPRTDRGWLSSFAVGGPEGPRPGSRVASASPAGPAGGAAARGWEWRMDQPRDENSCLVWSRWKRSAGMPIK